MANLKSKTLLGALALASSLLIATTVFAQTATPEAPAPTKQPAAAPATLSPLETPALLATAVPPSSMEDDRRILRGDRTISGDNFILRSGETLRGDLTIFGGNATLEENSIVEGNVTVFGGNADIAGTVTGNVSLVGGTVLLRNSAVVDGNLSRVGGTFNREAGAVVHGEWTTMGVPGAGNNTTRVVRNNGPFEWFFSLITNTITAILGAILISLLAIAIVALLPNNVVQAVAVLQANWLMAGVIGALTLFAVPIIAVILAITICLIPVSLLLMLAYVVAIVAGWTISARVLGERVMHAVHRNDWTLIGQTLAGAVLLALLGSVPIIGGLIGFVATALGLGALVLTRAGTRPYPMPVTALVPAGPISPVVPMDTPFAPAMTTPPSAPPTDAPVAPAAPDAPADEWWKTSEPPSKDRPSTDAPTSDTPPPDAPPNMPA